MCGIHGVISSTMTHNKSKSDFISQAFVANSLRGMHGSGVYQISKSCVPFMNKQATNGTDFMASGKGASYAKDADTSRITVCHVRHKTQGNIDDDSSHPFIAFKSDTKERVIGVHNGTLYNWKSNADASKYGVDSEWAIDQIAEHGAEAFKKFSGAWCFVWWDEADPKKVKFCRNDQRPMHILFNTSKTDMLFASEAGMLTWLAERVKFDHNDEVLTLPTDKIVTFDTSGNTITWTVEDCPKSPYSSAYSGDTYDWGGSSHSYGKYTRTPSTSSVVVAPQAILRMEAEWNKVLSGEKREVAEAKKEEDNNNDNFDYISDKGFIIPDRLFSPSNKQVNSNEIEEAKNNGSYGAVELFSPVIFSDRERVLYGEVKYIVGKHQYTADAVLRDLSYADSKKVEDNADVIVVGIEQDGTLVCMLPQKRASRWIEKNTT